MAIETVLRNTKKLYEKRYLQEPKQLYHVLFPELDMSIEESILLDEYVQSPYAMAYRGLDGVAHIRKHVPGSGTLYTPPIASEKTPIDEVLSGQLEAGLEATSGYQASRAARIDRILSNHIAGHNMTKNKQALDIFRTGVFYAKGLGETDIGLNEDFDLAAGNSLTPDFTDSATIANSFTAAQEQLFDQGCEQEELFAIVGSDWLNKIRSDSTVLSVMQANSANMLIRLQANPPEWAGTKGLSYQGTILMGGMLKPVDIFSYSPGVAYKATPTDASGYWLDSDEAIFGSWASPRYRVFRGINVLDNSEKIVRTSGEMIFDGYVSREPVAEYLRSSTRHLFLPGDVNHMLISTGTFS